MIFFCSFLACKIMAASAPQDVVLCHSPVILLLGDVIVALPDTYSVKTRSALGFFS
jgi:hypothetical protein